MILSIIKNAIWYYPRSVFTTLGFFWLIIEPILGLTGESINLTYWQLVALSAIFGLIWTIIDGLYFSGFLKHSIEITSNGFDTKIVVKFGDIFHENGWKTIAVNDFFDSIVDDQIVSSKSLHGNLLQKYWAGNIADWNCQIDEQLVNFPCSSETRSKGKQNRYKIGTTATAKKDGNKFLCVALSYTNISNNETQASSSDLHQAVRELLKKARSVCGNELLSIPLMGSGLSRVGMKSNILVDVILTAIFEETKNKKVTSEIHIVLSPPKASEIDLTSLKKHWS